jgi:threonine aldolase
MRFISAPWLGMLENDVWLSNARHANAMAQLLHQRIVDIPGVRIMFPTESNAVFAELPLPAIEALRAKGWLFYTFIGAGGCRLMCSWDLQPETVEAFAADIRAACAL